MSPATPRTEKNPHESLVSIAEKTIRKIYADRSVDRATAVESLKTLREEIDACLDTLGVSD